MITADHGCDPAYTATTDHTREYVPLVVLGQKVKPVNLGTRGSFADIAATVAELLAVPLETPGTSFAPALLSDGRGGGLHCSRRSCCAWPGGHGARLCLLLGYQVGAALLCADGTVSGLQH